MSLKAMTYNDISLMLNKFVVNQSCILQIHKQRASGVQQYTLNTFGSLILISSSYFLVPKFILFVIIKKGDCYVWLHPSHIGLYQIVKSLRF